MTLIAKELVSVQPLAAPSGGFHFYEYIYNDYSITHSDGTIVLKNRKKKINNKIIIQEENIELIKNSDIIGIKQIENRVSGSFFDIQIDYGKSKISELMGIPKKYFDNPIMTRYANKQINTDFYGTFKI